MAYTNIDDPSAHFQTETYTGAGANTSVTFSGNSDLKPDFLWIKNRGASYGHFVVDSNRNISYEQNSSNAPYLETESTAAENNNQNWMQSVNTDGFTTGISEHINSTASSTFVAWAWKANGGTVTTTPNGTQTTNNMQMATKHQINSDAGFSICTYQGATSYGSFYHGLGVKPDVVIIKSRTNAYDWVVYHSSLGYTTNLYLSETAAGDTSTAFFSAEPNTTQVYCKDHNSVFRPNGADSYLAYCFAEKQGYSKFGSYVGNGNADGTFVYTGFKPAFVMIKPNVAGRNWQIIDNTRDPHNAMDRWLQPNLSASEFDGSTASVYMDFLSNGFKLRTDNVSWNQSSQSIIYMAFAENPFVTSTGIPTTAR